MEIPIVFIVISIFFFLVLDNITATLKRLPALINSLRVTRGAGPRHGRGERIWAYTR